MSGAVVRVVGAALVRDGRLLAARRTAPPAAAGRWELPGGKVEPGETDEQALVREMTEELGVLVAVQCWLPGVQRVPAPRRIVELRVAVAGLVRGEPRPTEHDQLRWLAADELDQVDWLEPDRPFVTALAGLLGAGTG